MKGGYLVIKKQYPAGQCEGPGSRFGEADMQPGAAYLHGRSREGEDPGLLPGEGFGRDVRCLQPLPKVSAA